jgi:phospholipid-binding lipoprotein MlaA
MRSVLIVGVAALALGGCASQNLTIRSLPPETPAAANAADIEKFAAAAAAAAEVSRPAASDLESAPITPLVTTADAPSMYTYDPLERFNRVIYRFNARFDESVFLPVANGYRRIPGPVRSGVHNFFGNLSEVKSTVNYVLQLRPVGGIRSVGRFVVNSTIGIGGLFDVATKLKLPNPPTGFGVTLSKWGVHPGAYLVVPFLGPSTLRESLGLLGDFGIEYGINVANLYRGNKTYALGVVNAIDTRSLVSFRYYGSGSPFEYETIRFLYVRRALIEDEALHTKGRPKPRDAASPAGK